MDSVKQIDNELDNVKTTCDLVKTQVNNLINMSLVIISTMTIYYRSSKAINLSTLGTYTDSIRSYIAKAIDIDTITFKFPKNEKKSFKNAALLSITLKDTKKRFCCMIFSDGGIQVKGCKTVLSGYQIANAILLGIHGETDDNSRIHDVDIVLINSNFSIGKYIDLPKFHAALVANNWNASYDKEHHSGINLKITHTQGDVSKQITIMIFAKGNMTIMGGKAAAHIISGYAFIANFIKNHSNVFLLGNVVVQPKQAPKKRGRKRKAYTEAVYDELDI
jgi:TATA-box binding protein (TBP) (component of TFIID and TFIIIB)